MTEGGGFTDLSLSPRARDMALWLCDVVNTALDARSRAASVDLLLRELPDHWTAEDVEREAREIRMKLGPKASRRAWLDAAGWLVGEREQLPPKPERIVTEMQREAIRRCVQDTLAAFATQEPTAGSVLICREEGFDDLLVLRRRVVRVDGALLNLSSQLG